MRSSNLEYNEKLDHLRFAAFLLVLVFHTYHPVYSWLTNAVGTYAYTRPVDLLSIFVVDGHTGVALFLTLSGFLFARICSRTQGSYFSVRNFYLNRFLRIYPLFILILLMGIFWGGAPNPWPSLLRSLLTLQNTPEAVHIDQLNHLWTLACELQFYLVFPILLWLYRCNHGFTLLILFMGIDVFALAVNYLQAGDTLSPAYSTILGRINQCIVGMMLGFTLEKFEHRLRSPLFLLLSIGILSALLFVLHSCGGTVLGGTSPIWIVYPTLEGLAWAAVIASYVSCDFQLPRPLSRLCAEGGALSYSLYVWHFYFCLLMIRTVLPLLTDKQHKFAWLLAMQDWLIAHPFLSAVVFALFVVFPPTLLVSIFTYKYVEVPFFNLRRRYIFESRAEQADSCDPAYDFKKAFQNINLQISKFAKVSAVAAASMVVLLVGGELACIAYGVPKNAFLQPDEQLGTVRIPGRKLEWTFEGYSADVLSSVGLRDVEHAKEKPPGAKRIMLIGDSIVEAVQVPLANTAARLFQQKLHEDGYENVEVINAAHMNHSLGQTVSYYDRLARTFKPDEVYLVLDSFNGDINQRAASDFSVEARPYFYVTNNFLHEDSTLLPSKFECQTWRLLLQHSRLANWLVNQDLRLKLENHCYQVFARELSVATRSISARKIEYPAPDRREVRNALLSFLNRVVNSQGAKLTVFTKFYPTPDLTRRDFEEISDLSKRERFSLVSLDEALIKSGPACYGKAHLTARGQAVMSEKMYETFTTRDTAIAKLNSRKNFRDVSM
jgi:peptidoglycan/LPS O-acetylase OafA/YrhL